MNSQDIKDNILCWGYLDEKALDKYLSICYELDLTIANLEDRITDMEGDRLDINMWFYSCIDAIFYTYSDKLLDELDAFKYPNVYDKVQEYLEDLKDNFSPFINCLDSWFHNIFDELTFDVDKDIFIILKEIRK